MVPLHLVYESHEIQKVDYVTKVMKTVRVSEKNHRRLFSLAGKLQEIKGKKQTSDDAITYLFENHKEKSEQS